MKLFIISAFMTVAIHAASNQDLWVEFKNKHGKTYKSLREEKLRFGIFQEKLREIESHNAKYEEGEVSYSLRVNQFSDLTSDEFARKLNEKSVLKATKPRKTVNVATNIPDSINWVEKGAVLPVRDQKDCESSYAISAVEGIEGQIFIKYNETIALSAQQLVDCGVYPNGCLEEPVRDTLDYLVDTGLTTEADYPYTGVQGKCIRGNRSVHIRGYFFLSNDEIDLKNQVATVGPISVTLNTHQWQSYGKGIFDNPECSASVINHSVLVVGYGSENGQEYWLIKNSWGTSWGEDGYIRLARNKNGQCGIGLYSCYPVV
nr:cathepsin L-like proteinase [Leptinotarsa decemlineata]